MNNLNQNIAYSNQLTTIFEEKFGHKPAHITCAPGRVNLLGEHVDYNDGFVLPAAIDRATYLAFSPTNMHHSTLWAYVGVKCGIMDHFASTFNVENKLLLFDCRSMEWETVPFHWRLLWRTFDRSRLWRMYSQSGCV